MPLTLLVPDLFPPTAFPVDWPVTPGLDTLLSKGRLERGAAMTQEDWMLSAFNLKGHPVAALRRLATRAEPGVGPWMCADPVHLRIERDHLQLVSTEQLALTQGEAEALVASLNQHLSQDGLQIDLITAKEWVMRVPPECLPVTTPLWRAADRSVFDHLPAATGGINWKSLGNELQMLLHDHPVNAARESRGEPAISGVWFWGGDDLPETIGLAPEFIHASSTFARGLASHAKSELMDVPERFGDWRPQPDMSLIVLDELSRAVRAHDPDAWQQALARLEQDWFQPVMQAIWKKSLPMVRAVFPGEQGTHYLHASRADLWKLWRSRRPARTHV